MTSYEHEIIDLHDAARAASAAGVYKVAADFLAWMGLSHVCAWCCYAAHDQYRCLDVRLENYLPVYLCRACTRTTIQLPNGQVIELADWVDDKMYGRLSRKIT